MVLMLYFLNCRSINVLIQFSFSVQNNVVIQILLSSYCTSFLYYQSIRFF